MYSENGKTVNSIKMRMAFHGDIGHRKAQAHFLQRLKNHSRCDHLIPLQMAADPREPLKPTTILLPQHPVINLRCFNLHMQPSSKEHHTFNDRQQGSLLKIVCRQSLMWWAGVI